MDRTSIEANKFEKLVQRIAPESTLLRTWPLQGGISAEMTAFEIRNADGQMQRMILRRPGDQTLLRNPHAAEVEFKVLQLTKSLGLATPTPHYLDPSDAIFSTPYLVIEYMDGKPEFPPAPGANFISQVADHLAQIHSADLSSQDLSFLPRASSECVEISFKRSTDAQPSLDVAQIRVALQKISQFPQQNASVLLHGDYWPGNLLWRDERLIAVIDWEDAQIGDPLIDVAISRLDILWIFGVDAMHSFTHDYLSLMDIHYENLPYWDLCAALRLSRLIGSDLAEWTAFFHPFGRQDITDYTIREHFRFFITQAIEKLAL
ncbi:MAG: phosphotransferase family protein [Anaerolineales bacterium]